jgi:hypothetical protein
VKGGTRTDFSGSTPAFAHLRSDSTGVAPTRNTVCVDSWHRRKTPEQSPSHACVDRFLFDSSAAGL